MVLIKSSIEDERQQQRKDVFNAACKNNNLHNIKEMLFDDDILKLNPRHGMIFSVIYGKLENVKFFLDLIHNDPFYGLNGSFSEQLYGKDNKDDYIHKINQVYTFSVEKGHINILKYLLQESPQKHLVDLHLRNDEPIRKAIEANHLPTVQFLIYDMNIEKTESIESFFDIFQNEYKEALQMFDKRDLKHNLEKELNNKNKNIKNDNKNKI